MALGRVSVHIEILIVVVIGAHSSGSWCHIAGGKGKGGSSSWRPKGPGLRVAAWSATKKSLTIRSASRTQGTTTQPHKHVQGLLESREDLLLATRVDRRAGASVTVTVTVLAAAVWRHEEAVRRECRADIIFVWVRDAARAWRVGCDISRVVFGGYLRQGRGGLSAGPCVISGAEAISPACSDQTYNLAEVVVAAWTRQAWVLVVVPFVAADVTVHNLTIASQVEMARRVVARTRGEGHGRLSLLLASLMLLMGGQGSESEAC